MKKVWTSAEQSVLFHLDKQLPLVEFYCLLQEELTTKSPFIKCMKNLKDTIVWLIRDLFYF